MGKTDQENAQLERSFDEARLSERHICPVLGFYEYRAGAYHPMIGRFMSEDPKLFDAGDYNLFRYVGNDPLDRVDPMGLDSTTKDEALLGTKTIMELGSNIPREVTLTSLGRIVDARQVEGLLKKNAEGSKSQGGLSMAWAGLAGRVSAAQHESQSQRARGSTATFSKRDQQIIVTKPNGDALTYPAGNNTIRPNGDPYRVDSNGPAPNGTFPVQRPVPMGNSPKYGPYFYPIGAVGSNGERLDIARERGIGLHGGRVNYQSRTEGCIRMNNADLRNLYNQTQNAPLQSITIGD